jgi:hypothetical protein
VKADALWSVALSEAADHEQPIAVRLEGPQDQAELEAGALRGGRPMLHAHSVGQVDDAEAIDRARGGAPLRGHRRNHPVEKRQRQARSEPTQDCPAVDRELFDDHDLAFRI